MIFEDGLAGAAGTYHGECSGGGITNIITVALMGQTAAPRVATPTFSLEQGAYTSAQTVTISSATPSATIYYTTDGTTPTTSSNGYNGPITVSSSETVKAIAVASGYAESLVGSAIYSIGASPAYVQECNSFQSYGTSLSCTLSGVKAGDTLMIGFYGPTTLTVTSSAGAPTVVLSDGYGSNAYILSNASGGTITITGSINDNESMWLSVVEYTNVGSSPLDGSAQGDCGSSCPYISSDNFTTSAASDRLWSLCSGPEGTTMTAGTSPIAWNGLPAPGGSSGLIFVEDGIAGPPGTYFGQCNYANTVITVALMGESVGARAATPTFSPAPGSFSSPQTVTISTTTQSATIYYTTDGSTPTTSSSVYRGPITVNSSATLKAIAAADGDAESFVGSGICAIGASPARVQQCSNFQSYTESVSCTLTGVTAGDTLLIGVFGPWGTDDIKSVTSSSGTPVSVVTDGEFSYGYLLSNTISGNITIVANTYNGGPLLMTVDEYINVATSPLDGNGSGNCDSTCSTLSSTTFNTTTTGDLLWTMCVNPNGPTVTAGSAPVTWSGLPTPSFPQTSLLLEQGLAGTAGSYYGQCAQADSLITIALKGNGAAVAATPTFSPAGGSYNSIQTLSISTTTPSATIYYTTDGSTPTTSSKIYNGAIIVSSSETVQAIALAAGYTQSAVSASTYTITTVPPAAAPKISPVSGTYSAPQSVTITDATSGAVIYYTTDGSVPTTSSSIYSGSITASSTGAIRALATAPGFALSPISTVNYIIASGPTITGISPTTGPIGTRVTISGGDFGTSGTVTFNGVPSVPSSWGNDTIIVPVPDRATTGPIVVTTNQGASNRVPFFLGSGISGIAPISGNVGTSVVISGGGFGSTQASSVVTFNGVPAISSSWSDSSITVSVPPGATTGNVAVLTGGVSISGPLFTLIPSIVSLSPSSGPVGAIVTISGSNFGAIQGNSTVSFGQIVAVPSQWSQDTIIVPVPGGAVSGSVVVTVAGQSSNAVPFSIGSMATGSISGTVTQSDGVTPVVGASVSIYQGSNRVASTTTSASGSYSVGNLLAATYNLRATAAGFGTGSQSGVTVQSGQVVTANLSLSVQRTISYTYDKNGRLTGVADSASGSATYTYDAVGNILSIANSGTQQISILGFSPASGPFGTEVTISGTGFATVPDQNTVVIGGANASVVSGTATQLVVTVPNNAATGPIVVTTPNGSASSSGSFLISTTGTGGPSIASFAPAMGNAGGTIIISGTGFDPNSAYDLVKFTGALALAPVVSATGTNLSVTIPANASSGPISVETPAGKSVSSSNFFVIPAGYAANNVDFVGQLAVGQPYTGTINTAGDMGIVTFQASAGQQLTLAETNSSVFTTLYLLKPDGSLITGTDGPLSYSGPMPETGYYTILVETLSSRPTGSLTFSLRTNTQVVTPVNPGVATAIDLGTSGQNQAFSFNGTAGQLASVLLTNLTQCGAIVSIVGPDGTAFASGTAGCNSFFLGPVSLAVTGTYEVIVAPQQQSSGSATLTISQYNTPAPISTVPAMPLIVTISNPGQNALLDFSGSAGQLARLQFSNVNFPDGTLVKILGPDGTLLVPDGGVSSNTFVTLTLPANGTYTAVVSPQKGDTGSFTVELSLNAQTITTIAPGTPANATISTSGQSAQFIFTAATGQYASVILSQSTFPAQTSMAIIDSQGNTMGNSASGNVLGPVLLQEDDTYTLVIAPSGGGTGSATVNLSLSTPQAGGGLSSGTLVPFTISAPNQSVQFSFSGTAGQLISAMLPNSPFPDGASIFVAAPDGTLLASGNLGGGFSNSIDSVTLPVSGTYTLTLAPLNGDTGTADVILWLFNNQTGLGISPGSPVGLSISIPGQTAQFSFTGTAGQSASVQLSSITFSCKMAISIVGPDGTTLVINQDNTGRGTEPAYGLNPVALPVTGTYTLVISPVANGPFGSSGSAGPIGSDGSTGSAIIALSLQ